MGWKKKREKKRKEKKIIYTDRDFVRPVCILYYVPRLCFKKKNQNISLETDFFWSSKTHLCQVAHGISIARTAGAIMSSLMSGLVWSGLAWSHLEVL